MQLLDFAGAMGRAQQLVPDWAQEELERKLGALKTQTLGVQNRAVEQEIAANDRKAVEGEAYKSAIAELGAAPSPERLRMLGVRFPEFAKNLNDFAGAKDAAQQRYLVGGTAQLYTALANNQPTVAIKRLKREMDADKAAGRPADEDDKALLAMIESGDPQQIKAAKGMLYGILAAADPDSAAKVIGEHGGTQGFTLSPGSKRFDATGKVVAEAPFAPRTVTVGEGQTVVEYDPNGGGGDPASSGGRADGQWETFHANFLGPTEGGYAARDGASGAPVNFGVNQRANPDVDVRNLTPEQGRNILRDRYWRKSGADRLPPGLAEVHGDTAVNMGVGAAADLLKRSGRNVGKYLDLREARYREIGGKDLPAWLSRTERLRAYVGGGAPASAGSPGGGARVIAQGVPKAGAVRMTAAEIAAEGLDPNTVYYRSKDGVPNAVEGQAREKPVVLKPWPAVALNVRSSNLAALRNISGTLDLLDAKNQSPAAKTARAAVGWGTGMMGETVTNWRDPKGTEFRAQIGQIGGIIIKDTSGAAVSLSEDARLAKWVPLVTDSAGTVQSKLRNLRRELSQRNQALDDTFTEEQGFRSFKQGGDPVAVRSIQEAQRLAPGTIYRAPDGKLRRR